MAFDSSSPNWLSDEDFQKSVFEDAGATIVDLSDVKALSFEALPKGIYNVVVDQCSFQKSKASGQPMLAWVFEVSEGEYANRKVFLYTSFSQKALRGTKATLQKIDPVAFGGQFNPQQIADSGAMLGKMLRVRLTVEDGDQGEQNRVQVLGAATGDAGSQASGQSGDGAFFK